MTPSDWWLPTIILYGGRRDLVADVPLPFQLLSDSVSVEGCLDEWWAGPTYEVRSALWAQLEPVLLTVSASAALYSLCSETRLVLQHLLDLYGLIHARCPIVPLSLCSVCMLPHGV